jgi:hypothetical protein
MSNMKLLPELSQATATAAAAVIDRSSGLPEPDEAMLHHEELHSPHKPQPVRRIQVEHLYLCILCIYYTTAIVLLLLSNVHYTRCNTPLTS